MDCWSSRIEWAGPVYVRPSIPPFSFFSHCSHVTNSQRLRDRGPVLQQLQEAALVAPDAVEGPGGLREEGGHARQRHALVVPDLLGKGG